MDGFLDRRLREQADIVAYEWGPNEFARNLIEPLEIEGVSTSIKVTKTRAALKGYLEFLGGTPEDIDFKLSEFDTIVKDWLEENYPEAKIE